MAQAAQPQAPAPSPEGVEPALPPELEAELPSAPEALPPQELQ